MTTLVSVTLCYRTHGCWDHPESKKRDREDRKEGDFWDVTRQRTMTICTGIDKTWDMDWGWYIIPSILAALREEKSPMGTISPDQIQRSSTSYCLLLPPPRYPCTSVPTVTPQRCTAASSLHTNVVGLITLNWAPRRPCLQRSHCSCQHESLRTVGNTTLGVEVHLYASLNPDWTSPQHP